LAFTSRTPNRPLPAPPCRCQLPLRTRLPPRHHLTPTILPLSSTTPSPPLWTRRQHWHATQPYAAARRGPSLRCFRWRRGYRWLAARDERRLRHTITEHPVFLLHRTRIHHFASALCRTRIAGAATYWYHLNNTYAPHMPRYTNTYNAAAATSLRCTFARAAHTAIHAAYAPLACHTIRLLVYSIHRHFFRLWAPPGSYLTSATQCGHALPRPPPPPPPHPLSPASGRQAGHAVTNAFRGTVVLAASSGTLAHFNGTLNKPAWLVYTISFQGRHWNAAHSLPLTHAGLLPWRGTGLQTCDASTGARQGRASST